MGLVHIFRASPCPPLLVRRLLRAILAELQETGHHYQLFLVQQRQLAQETGADDEVANLDASIRKHLIRQQIPSRWNLDFLFGFEGFEIYGRGIFRSGPPASFGWSYSRSIGKA